VNVLAVDRDSDLLDDTRKGWDALPGGSRRLPRTSAIAGDVEGYVHAAVDRFGGPLGDVQHRRDPG
jgi:hypothetical protein